MILDQSTATMYKYRYPKAVGNPPICTAFTGQENDFADILPFFFTFLYIL